MIIAGREFSLAWVWPWSRNLPREDRGPWELVRGAVYSWIRVGPLELLWSRAW